MNGLNLAPTNSFDSPEDMREKGYTPLSEMAKQSCSKCYGTGIAGRTAPINMSQSQPIICKCIEKAMKKMRAKEIERMRNEAITTVWPTD